MKNREEEILKWIKSYIFSTDRNPKNVMVKTYTSINDNSTARLVLKSLEKKKKIKVLFGGEIVLL